MINAEASALAQSAANALAAVIDDAHPSVLLVPGSGWGRAAATIGRALASVEASTVPGFRPSPVAGHTATIDLLAFEHESGEDLHVLVLPRTHFYEGHGSAAVAHSVRVAAALGISSAILTNGCGAIPTAFVPGTVAVLRDHINLTGATPLEGAAFVDLSNAYSPRLRDLVHSVAPSVLEAVYAQFPGPQYETPAEVQMARTLGADLVGMSTALETIAAREVELEVLALSLVTNPAAGTASDQQLDHSEVLAQGAVSVEALGTLLSQILRVWPLN